jgi:hypothetical protein
MYIPLCILSFIVTYLIIQFFVFFVMVAAACIWFLIGLPEALRVVRPFDPCEPCVTKKDSIFNAPEAFFSAIIIGLVKTFLVFGIAVHGPFAKPTLDRI